MIIVIEFTERIEIANSLVKSVIKNGFKDCTEKTSVNFDKYNIAIRKPTSPTRVIRKAFLDAAAAEGRVVQNPINK